MRLDTQHRLMRQVLAHMAAGTTDMAESVYRQATAAYSSAERLAREKDVLFRQFPLMVGLSCQIPKPGDHFTDDNAGVPLLVVRGEDGVVRAFLNVCRHRGARVAEGCGHERTFTCPYHGWTYGLDGRLRGIPDRRSFPGVELEQHGLVPLPVAERDGLLWVKPRPDPTEPVIDIAAHLGGLDDELAAYGLDGYHHYETRLIRRQMNWKLVLDTFLEAYHLGVLHKKTVAPLFISNLSLFEPFGRHLREILPRRSMDTQVGLPDDEWDFIAHNTVVYILFPNTALIVQVDHVETWRVFPVPGKVDACVMVLDFYVPNPIDSDSARRHWERNMDLTIRTVCDEDFPVGEGIQRGMGSGAQTHTSYGRNEPALAHFERNISDALAE